MNFGITSAMYHGIKAMINAVKICHDAYNDSLLATQKKDIEDAICFFGLCASKKMTEELKKEAEELFLRIEEKRTADPEPAA